MKISNFKFQISNFKKGQAPLFPPLAGSAGQAPLRPSTSSGLRSGQAMIILVAVVAIATFIISEVFILSTSSLILSVESSEFYTLYSKAEGYAENAAIRFLRDPNYTGESLNEGDISCTIDITDLGGGVSDISSSCQKDGRTQTVGIGASNRGGSFTFSKIQKR